LLEGGTAMLIILLKMTLKIDNFVFNSLNKHLWI